MPIILRPLPFAALAGLLWTQIATSQEPSPVTFEALLHAQDDPANWITYSGSYASQRHSRLKQITPANVKNLEQQWVFQAESLEKFEATPLVVDGVLYTVQPPNDLVAMDAATGRIFWIYYFHPSKLARNCCGNNNRGVAILGNTLYMGTIDGHLVAVRAKDGSELWNISVARPELGYSIMHAPLIVKDKVIVGTGGGEFGIRGFIAAFDPATGKELWRFHTIPGPSDPGHETWSGDAWMHGSAPVWVTGSYDPDLNLTYWGTGNPGPDWNGEVRPGDNLFSDSVVALDPDTGKLKWYYQFTPHDEMDYDSAQVPVLADVDWPDQAGVKRRKVILWANRNGFFYVLDRATGQVLSGKPFVKVNWASGIDAAGRPVRVPGVNPSPQGTLVYPGVQGGTNWYSPSYSPVTGLFYVSSWEEYSSVYVRFPVTYEDGVAFVGGWPRTPVAGLWKDQAKHFRSENGHGVVRAIDPVTGARKWDFKMENVTEAGILTTASNVLFSGGREGYFYALDARTGTVLWRATVGGIVISGPMTYSVNGRQYVAVAAGHSLFVYALRR